MARVITNLIYLIKTVKTILGFNILDKKDIKRLNLAINKVYKHLNYYIDNRVVYANYRLAKTTRDSRVVKNLTLTSYTTELIIRDLAM